VTPENYQAPADLHMAVWSDRATGQALRAAPVPVACVPLVSVSSQNA
jgi:hypothetical protein